MRDVGSAEARRGRRTMPVIRPAELREEWTIDNQSEPFNAENLLSEGDHEQHAFS
jgi:hypothetical protein